MSCQKKINNSFFHIFCGKKSVCISSPILIIPSVVSMSGSSPSLSMSQKETKRSLWTWGPLRKRK